MLEAEAVTKWCPFAKESEETGSFNREHKTLYKLDMNGNPMRDEKTGKYITTGFQTTLAPACHCIASRCMAWHPETELSGSCKLMRIT